MSTSPVNLTERAGLCAATTVKGKKHELRTVWPPFFLGSPSLKCPFPSVTRPWGLPTYKVERDISKSPRIPRKWMSLYLWDGHSGPGPLA